MPLPAPAPVQVVNSDIFVRARVATVQSRVAALVVGIGREHLRFVCGHRARHLIDFSCGCLRRSGARVCNRCGQATQARPPAVGDTIMERLGAPTAAAGVAGATHAWCTRLQFPTNFTQRIRLLPANTLLHIPSSCRLRSRPQRGAGKAWPMEATTSRHWRRGARSSCWPRYPQGLILQPR